MKGQPPGEAHRNAFLTNEQVLELRKRYEQSKLLPRLGRVTLTKLAEEYEISKAHASRIVNRKNWKL